jgi:serine/threonine-protein kinase
MSIVNDREPPEEPGTSDDPQTLVASGLGSGLLAQQPTPSADEAVTIARVCPQCGAEFETGDRFCPKDGTPLRPKAGGDPFIGRVIADRYLILARLGEGGMGRVYLAEHVKMNRQCAVKVMSPSLVTDHESLQRFAREASSAARILHPNVAAIFDYGEADKIVYLVMEFVDGESLSEILAREGTLDPRRAIDIARQIADGLHAAHELGIVHRDLKPDNVIVARNRGGKEIPKVVDFGIAKAMTEAPQDALTRSGLVIGTPEYMSPEQLLGDPVNARTDIYSLGCILYQMLTGAPAFAAETREQMIRRRLHESPPHVRDLLPDLPRRLDTLIVHMLARSPADRMASAAEARDALDPALVLNGWDAAERVASAELPLPVNRPLTDPTLQPTIPMMRVKTSPARIAIGTAVGAALLVGGLMLWSKASTTQTTAAATTPVVNAPADTTHAAVPGAVTRDSAAKLPPLAKAEPKDTAPKPKIEETTEFDAPIARLESAIENKDLAAVQAAFPGFTPSLRGFFENLFTRVGSGKPAVRRTLGPVNIQGNHAERSVKITIRYTEAGSLQPITNQLPVGRAEYNLRAGKWTLVNLAAR